ncbi:major facilitator superfamily domain-containing protein [Entophlyctis helioformis]|nr:major facilitator superfamily domain-containing protein [Entophlyctis helioformis]
MDAHGAVPVSVVANAGAAGAALSGEHQPQQQHQQPQQHSVIITATRPHSPPRHAKRSLMAALQAFRRSSYAVVLVVALALFTDMAVYGVVIPTLPRIIVDRLGLDEECLGVLISAHAAGLILIAPTIGILSDRLGNRKMPMVLGLIGLLLTTLLFAYGTSFTHLLLARMGQGISGGVSWTLGFCMLADVFPHDKLGTIMGSVLMANTVGSVVGPPLGGVLLEFLGETAPFLFCAGLVLLDLAGRLLIRPTAWSLNYDEPVDCAALASSGMLDSPPVLAVAANEQTPLLGHGNGSLLGISSSGLDPVGAAAAADAEAHAQTSIARDSGSAQRRPTGDRHPTTMVDLLSDPQIVVTLVCVVANSTVLAGIQPTLPLYLARDFGASPSLVGSLWMCIVLPSMVGCTWAGYISDKYGRKNVTAFGTLVFAVSSPLIAMTGSLYVMAVALGVFGLASSVALTPAMPEMADFVHARGGDGFGTAYALYNVAYSGGMLVGPIAGSLLYERYGFLVQMQLLGAVLLLCAPLAMAFHRRCTV